MHVGRGGGGGALSLIEGLKGHPCCERRVSLCTPEVQEDHRLRAIPNHKAGYIPNRCKHSQKPPYTSGRQSVKVPFIQKFSRYSFAFRPTAQTPVARAHRASLSSGRPQTPWPRHLEFLGRKMLEGSKVSVSVVPILLREVVSCWTFLLPIHTMQRCDSRCKTANIARHGIIAM